MKITDISAILLTVPVAEIRWAGGVANAVPTTLIQVNTDEGFSGLGEVYCGMFVPAVVPPLVDHFRARLLGMDPLQIPRVWNKMYGTSLFWGRAGVAVAVMSAIENALWDIAGKAAGLPVYRLLGGLSHESLPVYASGGLDKSADAFTAELQEYKGKGFRAVKIRIGHGVQSDSERVCLAREVLGPEIKIMVDAVQGHNPEPWQASTAIAVAHAIEGYDITWFEEPCVASDPDAYARVRDSTCIPIAGGESCTCTQEFRGFFEADALDIVQPDVAHAGGILACRAVAAVAQVHGVQLAPHSWGTGALLAATYHFGFATSNCQILEYPTWDNPLRDELLVRPFDIREGLIYPSDLPGLGVELREETIAKYPYNANEQLMIRRTTRAAY
jgi:L-alanine-DL-glutamate epimerase-like enolase superfamily enzyme